jgi:hypothetical protein
LTLRSAECSRMPRNFAPLFTANVTTDQCDSTSHALGWIKSGYNENVFFRWLELDEERVTAGETVGYGPE